MTSVEPGILSLTRKRNVFICLSVAFYLNLASSLLLPSLWPYLQENNVSKDWLGWPIAMFSLGQLIGSPSLGAMSTAAGFKKALLTGLTLQTLSYLAYAQVSSFNPSPGVAVFLISFFRFVGGLGMGSIAVVLAFIAEHSTPAERTNFVANIEITVALAFTCGPGFSLLLALTPSLHGSFFKFDHTTSPAWLGSLLGVIMLVIVASLFKKTPRVGVHSGGAANLAESANHDDNDENENDDETDDQVHSKETLVIKSSSTTPILQSSTAVVSDSSSLHSGGGPPILGIERGTLVCVALAFVALLQNNGLSVYETVSVPIMEDDFQFHVLETSLVWTLIGFSSTCGLIFLKLVARARARALGRDAELKMNRGKLVRWLHVVWPPSEFALMCSNFFLAGLGFFLIAIHALPPLWLFILGSFLVATNYPQASAGLAGHYTRVVGRQGHQQGVAAGIFFGAGATARLLGPLYSAPMFSHFHSAPVFALTTICFAFSLVILFIIRKHL